MGRHSIDNVADTAFWIAHYRATESARPDALFHDPLAAVVAGDRGARIAASMKAPHFTSWAVSLRTHVIDGMIRDCVTARGVDLVLSLGAGLDTRPYRLDLPSPVTWVEADYPDVLEYKRETLRRETPRVRLHSVDLDLLDRAARRQMLADHCSSAGRVLVLTEGVVPFFTNDQVTQLAEDLRQHQQIRFWISEYFDPLVLRYMKFVRRHEMHFPFEPGDWLGFFERRGWPTSQMHYLGEICEALGRPQPAPRFLKVLQPFLTRGQRGRIKRFVGYMLMERHGSG